MATSSNVIGSLMGYLYTVLTDGQEEFIKRNERERFITWCLPGIPYRAEDLRFLHRGLVGEGEGAAKAADTAILLQQAATFARLVDFVPSVTGLFEQNELVAFQPGITPLSRVYEKTLKQSRVAKAELTPEEKERLERFRGLLYPEQDVEDLLTGKKSTKRVEGPVLKQYKELMAKYEEAFFAYNTQRIKAMGAASAEDVLRFSTEEPVLRQRLKSVMGDWEGAGRKSEVEQVQAYINQVTARDLVLWKADLLDRFDKSRLSLPTGEQFFYSSLVPASFVAGQGWTTVTFNDKDVEKHSTSKKTQYEVGGGFSGAFKIGGKVSGSTESKHELSNVTNFSMAFQVAQIPISAAWLDASYLQSHAWKFGPDAIEVDALSDGGAPPKGMLVGYPTMVIFIKDVKVDFTELHDESNEVTKQLKAKGGLGWGPLKLSGSYQRDSKELTVESKLTERGLEVDGMQIIGFRCRLLDKSPDPRPEIKEFV